MVLFPPSQRGARVDVDSMAVATDGLGVQASLCQFLGLVVTNTRTTSMQRQTQKCGTGPRRESKAPPLRALICENSGRGVIQVQPGVRECLRGVVYGR